MDDRVHTNRCVSLSDAVSAKGAVTVVVAVFAAKFWLVLVLHINQRE